MQHIAVWTPGLDMKVHISALRGRRWPANTLLSRKCETRSPTGSHHKLLMLRLCGLGGRRWPLLGLTAERCGLGRDDRHSGTWETYPFAIGATV